MRLPYLKAKSFSFLIPLLNKDQEHFKLFRSMKMLISTSASKIIIDHISQ